MTEVTQNHEMPPLYNEQPLTNKKTMRAFTVIIKLATAFNSCTTFFIPETAKPPCGGSVVKNPISFHLLMHPSFLPWVAS